MSDTKKRIIVAGALVLALVLVIVLERWFNINATRYVGILTALLMIWEFVRSWIIAGRDMVKPHLPSFIGFGALLFMCLFAINYVGQRPELVLLMLIIIACADMGAWLFGTIIGGDKMWEKISEHKTWTGQIAGIVCGTLAALVYGYVRGHNFIPTLIWIGISISLLSQYGDLSASWIKRKLGIKDFGTLLPGHGGILDRFDGWVYVLPLLWLIMR